VAGDSQVADVEASQAERQVSRVIISVKVTNRVQLCMLSESITRFDS